MSDITDYRAVLTEYSKGDIPLHEAVFLIINIIRLDKACDIASLPKEMREELVLVAVDQLKSGKLTFYCSAGIFEDLISGNKLVTLLNKFQEEAGEKSIEEIAESYT